MEKNKSWDKMLTYDEEEIDKIIKKIGRKIQEKRLEKNWSILDFCDKANISYSNLYKIESGQSAINLRTFLKAIIALDTTPDSLLDLSDKVNGYTERFIELTKEIDKGNMDFLLEMIKNWVE